MRNRARVWAVCGVLLAGAGATSAREADCARFFAAHPEIRFVDATLWVTSLVPDEGAYDLFFQRPVLPDDARYVPASFRESDCLLDRMLDPRFKQAMLSAAPKLPRKAREIDDYAENSWMESVDGILGPQVGLDGPCGCVLSLLSEIQSEFEFPVTMPRSPGRLRRHAHARGIDNGNLVTWLVVISYLRHLGADGLDLDAYWKAYRRLERESHEAPDR